MSQEYRHQRPSVSFINVASSTIPFYISNQKNLAIHPTRRRVMRLQNRGLSGGFLVKWKGREYFSMEGGILTHS